MASSSAGTVEQYLDELPAERRTAIEGVRNVILANLPNGFEEGMQYGMISYYVPLARYPETYNGEAALARRTREPEALHVALPHTRSTPTPGAEDWFADRGGRRPGEEARHGEELRSLQARSTTSHSTSWPMRWQGRRSRSSSRSYERGRGLA